MALAIFLPPHARRFPFNSRPPAPSASMAIGTILVGVGFLIRSSSSTLMWLGGGTTEASNPLIAEGLAMLMMVS
ncbi:hypothetical protein MUK42_03445 [Musa troglodytarum]|uniref:Uncharacterized protein n=1 Tax=Musa troglodytarum TaxID=320322 RepID=A0A9E7GUF0_9LILI|nr:hypothetical protein MUK42_03445 [Musa troglodytarum]